MLKQVFFIIRLRSTLFADKFLLEYNTYYTSYTTQIMYIKFVLFSSHHPEDLRKLEIFLNFLKCSLLKYLLCRHFSIIHLPLFFRQLE